MECLSFFPSFLFIFFWKLFAFVPNRDLAKLFILWNGQFRKSDCSLKPSLVDYLVINPASSSNILHSSPVTVCMDSVSRLENCFGFRADEWARLTTFHHNTKIYLQMRSRWSITVNGASFEAYHLYFNWSFPDIEHMQNSPTSLINTVVCSVLLSPFSLKPSVPSKAATLWPLGMSRNILIVEYLHLRFKRIKPSHVKVFWGHE